MIGTVLAELPGVRGAISILVGLVVAVAACAEPEDAASPDASSSARADLAPAAAAAESGEGGSPSAGVPGFLVWESNRSGAWRLWIRDLEGGEPRQLTPDERGRRRHCCPHVSPDGAWVTYVSLPDGKPEYSDGSSTGPLRLIRPDGSEQRDLAAAARTYFEHRAALWRSSEELIHIDDAGRTVLVEIATGNVRRLTDEPRDSYGALVDSQLRWATNGDADFGVYQADKKQVVERYTNRGCQGYFSPDGRWGFWTAGVGGPINRFDLATGRSTPILHKNDSRLPPGLGYLYFPMLSPDGSMLAFAASRNQHDHFRSDYEIFVVEVDEEMMPTGAPVRMTHDPSTDRFPDVWVEPLPLGRRSGEAPLRVEWRAPSDGDWRWQLGDGATATGPRAAHVYERPGRYEVTARRGERSVRGLVTVEPGRAPVPLEAALRERGRAVEVVFDEPLGTRAPDAELASGVPITDFSVSADGRTLRLELGREIRGGDTLRLSGLVDRAEPANEMAPTELELAPPLWPSDREALAFVWAHANAPNLVFDADLETERASTVDRSGRAIFDHHFRMVLGRGSFVASERDAEAVLTTLRAANRMTLEATVTPGESGQLIGMGGLHLNFVLRAEAGKIHVSIRTGNRGPGAFQGAAVASYRPGRPLHLVVTFTPGELRAYVDGEPAGEWPVSGDFFNWRRYPLIFGEGVTVAPGNEAWLEGVAIYGRILEADEVRENHLRYAALRAAREPVPQVVVDAELVRRSDVPTLAEISPYTEALVVEEWRITSTLEGDPPESTVRVARWAILDGETQAAVATGDRRRLTLEPFDRNPQLEGTFVSDDLAGDGRLYYSAD